MKVHPSIMNISTLSPAFLDSTSKDKFAESIGQALTEISRFFDKDQFYSGASVSQLKQQMQTIVGKLDQPLNLEDTLSELKELYLDHAIAFHHPDYIAHLNCPVLIPALVGDFIASSLNTAVETWDQSTSATLIEQEMINWTCRLFGLPQTADGVFTSGGTQSNFMGLLMARDDYAFKHLGVNIKQEGLTPDVSRFRVFCSDKAHFSVKKNAALLGMGYNSVVVVETDERFKMKPEALQAAIRKEKQQGNLPIAVFATAGTTDFGSFDPLNEICAVAKANDMWFHVDGAYGGCFALTHTHKHLFDGAQYADSITIDFHKTLFQPVCSSAFLVANQQNFRYVSHYADYLNPIETKEADFQNLIVKSVQTTRRFDALKLWFTLRMVDETDLIYYLETVHRRAIDAYELLQAQGCFELVHEPELSTVVFRYQLPNEATNAQLDEANLYIKNTLFNSGLASIASTRLNGNIYLKFTLLNPNTTVTHLQHIIELVVTKAAEYANSQELIVRSR